METVNVIIAGLGGQGAIRAADILCDLFFTKNHHVKRTEIHGMAQRGGPVVCHIRISDQEIYSPMIPERTADFILGLDQDEANRQSNWLKKDGEILFLNDDQVGKLKNIRSINVATLALLIKKLDELKWSDVRLMDLENFIREKFPAKLVANNLQALSIFQ